MTVGGVALCLLPGGGVFDPARGRLFVADLHLGKGAAMRAGGLPLPPGTSTETLARVDALVGRASVAGAEVREVWVLGDLVHARSGIDAGLAEEVAAWIGTLPGGRLHLVQGNHDVGAGGLPGAWAIAAHPDPFTPEGGPTLAHHPPEVGRASGRGIVAGHLHPAIRIGRGRRRGGKRPAFLAWGGTGADAPAVLVLPALGRLVDGAVLRGGTGLHAWAFDDDVVERVPPGAW
jgi:DNA ligase-associated metallophosphoesterase